MWWFDIISHANSVEINEMNSNDKKNIWKLQKNAIGMNLLFTIFLVRQKKGNAKFTAVC